MLRRTALSSLVLAGLLGATAASGWAAEKKTPAAAKPAASTSSAPAQAAQGAPAAQPPVGSEPGLTTATFGDWVLRCQRTGEGGAAKQCEVAQTLQLQSQQTTIAQIAFAKGTAPGDMLLTVAVPSNITLPSTATFGLGEKDPHPVDLTWRRCLPSACVASGTPPGSALTAFETATDPGRLSFRDSGGRDIGLPVSFRGLAQAIDALDK